MNVYTEMDTDKTSITLVLRSRDDLEKAIPWLPTLRVLFPYPEPPSDPKHGDFEPGGVPAVNGTAEGR